MLDAGYDNPRIAYLLSGLPVEILGRTRSDRVMRRPAPSREEFLLAHPKGGRPPKQSGEFVFGDPRHLGRRAGRHRSPTPASMARPPPRTVIRLAVDIDRCRQALLRRFDIEHTFRMLKQTLGWTRPRLRDSTAADRCTWLVLAAHTQLRLARPLATDLRRPWEKPAPPHQLTPARVRRGFRTHPRHRHGLPAADPPQDRDQTPTN
ncbi:transposase [Streptomyces anulatus]